MKKTKQILREQAKAIRASIPNQQRESDAKAIMHNIFKVLGTGSVVGTYYPIGTEITPPHVLNGYQMALPVIRDKTTLEFYLWSPTMRLVKRDFNIPIPDTRGLSSVIPDIILLPLLFCDKHGTRIGYGAGHYDRYINSLENKPLLIGVCFEEQVSHTTLPNEPHDKKLDLIITPKRIIEIP